MENFLTNCGLGHVINVFHQHEISFHQLRELTHHKELLKEILPSVGDRLKLLQGVADMDSKGTANDPSKDSAELGSDHEVSKEAVTLEPVTNDPSKKESLLSILRQEHRVAHLYRLATAILSQLSLFTFNDGIINCNRQPNWNLIDFDEGNLRCVVCGASIAIQIRGDRTATFNIGNYKRHYTVEHGLTVKPEEVEPGDVNESNGQLQDSAVHDVGQDVNSLDMNVTSVSEWKKGGVFGWAKNGCRSRFYPGFLLENKQFQRITKTSVLSTVTFEPFEFHEIIDTEKKYKRDVANLQEFNEKNGTSFK